MKYTHQLCVMAFLPVPNYHACCSMSTIMMAISKFHRNSLLSLLYQ